MKCTLQYNVITFKTISKILHQIENNLMDSVLCTLQPFMLYFKLSVQFNNKVSIKCFCAYNSLGLYRQEVVKFIQTGGRRFCLMGGNSVLHWNQLGSPFHKVSGHFFRNRIYQ